MDNCDFFVIPTPFQAVLDDVGWFCGYDKRKSGGPSRTGINRFHKPDDYRAIEYVGKNIGQRINCAFVLGEWDLKNEMKELPNFSHYGENWDNRRFRDLDEMIEIVKTVNHSKYIDMAVHGLFHGYYMEGTDNTDTSDFYFRIHKKLFMIPEKEVRQRLDKFFELAKSNGFKKEINSFVPPSFVYRKDELSRILKDYGIKYMSTIFRTMDSDEKEEYAVVENGIINSDRINNIVPWDALEFDFSTLKPTTGIFGIHWPNICGNDPAHYHKAADSAIEYFKKCGAQYGTVMSSGMDFCATQEIYKRYTKIARNENEIKLDFSNIPQADGLLNEFCISSKKPISGWENCTISEYERFDGHITYKIIPNGKIATVRF